MGGLLDNSLSFKEDFSFPSLKEWETLAKMINKSALSQKTYPYENINVKPLYTREDNTQESPDFPTNDNRGFLVCQRINEGAPRDVNGIIKEAVIGGADSIDLSLHPQTLFGRNDFKTSLHEGVIIDNYQQFSQCLQDVDISRYNLNIKAGLCGSAFNVFLKRFVEQNQFDLKSVKGAVVNDPLWIVGRYGYKLDLDAFYDEMTATVSWAAESIPELKSIGVNAAYLHNAGASAVQEVAFSMATAAEYIRALLDRGLNIDEIAKRFQIELSLSSDFYMNIAKLRALRLLWKNLIAAFGGDSEMEIYCHTSWREMSVIEPHNNLIRFTLQAVSAAVGGCDLFAAHDFMRPNDFSRRMARNIPLILKYESENRKHDFNGSIDGSFFMENLQSELSQKSWQLFQKIENIGGYYRALRKGVIRNDIKKTLNLRKERLSNIIDKIIGSNVYRKSDKNIALKNRENGSLKFNRSLQRITFNALDKLEQVLCSNKSLTELYWQRGKNMLTAQAPLNPTCLEKLIEE